jgi:nucleoid DNA-binding protein
MNKGDLVNAMAKCQHETKVSAERWLNCTLNCIAEGLKKHQALRLVGFGSFAVKARKGRIGRNPRTGAAIKIKPGKKVSFHAGDELKKTI